MPCTTSLEVALLLDVPQPVCRGRGPDDPLRNHAPPRVPRSRRRTTIFPSVSLGGAPRPPGAVHVRMPGKSSSSAADPFAVCIPIRTRIRRPSGHGTRRAPAAAATQGTRTTAARYGPRGGGREAAKKASPSCDLPTVPPQRSAARMIDACRSCRGRTLRRASGVSRVEPSWSVNRTSRCHSGCHA